MRIGPATYRTLITILIYGLLWGLAGFVFTLLERGVIGEMDVYPSTGVAYAFTTNIIAIPLVTMLGGMGLIVIDILVINKRVRRKSFSSIIAIKSVVFVLIIFLTTVVAGVLANTITLNKGIFSAQVWNNMLHFMDDFGFWSIMIYAGFMTVIFLFVIEVANSLGYRILWNFFSGRYHRPKVEDKVFMFMDLKNSTGIAEKLGHLDYYRFLNRFFEDISVAVLKSWGTIYQYVGDEVVIHWPRHKQKECIECFFLMQEIIRNKSAYYEQRFEFVPEFRAGVHGGTVSVGEIGTLRRDILYIGDILNTASRIQGLCKEYNVDVLVSDDIVSSLSPSQARAFKFDDKGYSQLRGKEQQIRVLAVRPRSGEQT